MARTTIASAEVFRRLARGQGRFRVRFPSHGRHVEGDIGRQVLALINGSRVERIYPMSCGKPSTPTVIGNFRVYMKRLRHQRARDGRLELLHPRLRDPRVRRRARRTTPATAACASRSPTRRRSTTGCVSGPASTRTVSRVRRGRRRAARLLPPPRRGREEPLEKRARNAKPAPNSSRASSGGHGAPHPDALRAATSRENGWVSDVVGVVDRARGPRCGASRAGARRPRRPPGRVRVTSCAAIARAALHGCRARLVDREQAEAHQHDRAGDDRDVAQGALEHGDRIGRSMTARESLIDELRTHALDSRAR